MISPKTVIYFKELINYDKQYPADISDYEFHFVANNGKCYYISKYSKEYYLAEKGNRGLSWTVKYLGKNVKAVPLQVNKYLEGVGA